ncbi:MAG TPA: hypothetical protein VMU24_09540 [Candidatus Acidoferrales bacterium]|nr:hypothetical protein [Candidatus Acidoferrales bacterium]
MKNWKTTAVGLAIAGLYAWQNASGGWKQQSTAVLIAIFGTLAKDFNTSCGHESA